MAKIVHLTTVHSPLDPRIFEKECVSLVAEGHDVVLIAPGRDDAVRNGVRIHSIDGSGGRLTRMTVTAYRTFRAALAEDADVYHFHDPELIPWGLALRLAGRQVVYDVHEDYVSGIAHKRYLLSWLRPAIGYCLGLLENASARAFHIVLAERYYIRRFPQGTTVLNYPTVSSTEVSSPAFAPGSRRLLYTGNVTADRGAFIHAGILAHRRDFELNAIGRCSAAVAAEMRVKAGENADRLVIEGVDAYVPFSRIRAAYEAGQWLCGVAVFPPTPHYTEKELTKFFEYMLAGLPVVCSDFPVWKELIEENGVGLCVPPDQPQEIIKALDWLIEHPGAAEGMALRGQQLARERFTWQSEASKLTSLYSRILSA